MRTHAFPLMASPAAAIAFPESMLTVCVSSHDCTCLALDIQLRTPSSDKTTPVASQTPTHSLGCWGNHRHHWQGLQLKKLHRVWTTESIQNQSQCPLHNQPQWPTIGKIISLQKLLIKFKKATSILDVQISVYGHEKHKNARKHDTPPPRKNEDSLYYLFGDLQ